MRTRRSEVVELIDRRLGDLVRRRRQALRLSQTQLAERLGVTYQQVQKYESGQTRISVALLIRLSEELDLTPNEFLDQLGPFPIGRTRTGSMG